MTEHEANGAYFGSSQEVAAAIDLPLLGELEAEAPFQQSSATGLSGLAPDPRLAERLYRFLDADVPLVWIAGLGDAGEELPVAVGLAARAAAMDAAPVLLAQREAGARRPEEGTGRPVASGTPLDGALGRLFGEAAGARPSGIQGVYHAYRAPAADGEPLEPASLVIASPAETGPLGAEAVPQVIVVVPYRDLPRELIQERLSALRSQGYPLVGFVGFSAAASEEAEPAAAVGASAPPSAADTDEESAAAAAFDSGEATSAAPAEEREVVGARGSWSRVFGPRRSAATGRARLILPVVAVLLLLAVIAVVVWRAGDRGPQAPVSQTPMTPAMPAAGEGEAHAAGAAAAEAPVTESAGAVAAAPAGQRDDALGGPATDADASPTGRQSAGAPAEAQAQPEAAGAPAAAQAQPEAPRAAQGADEVPSAIAQAAAEQTASSSASALRRSRTGPFALLCGSFRSPQRAAAEVARLDPLVSSARVVAVRIPDRGIWHRVLVGELSAVEEARALGRKLVEAGVVKTVQVVSDAGEGLTVGRPIVVPDATSED